MDGGGANNGSETDCIGGGTAAGAKAAISASVVWVATVASGAGAHGEGSGVGGGATSAGAASGVRAAGNAGARSAGAGSVGNGSATAWLKAAAATAGFASQGAGPSEGGGIVGSAACTGSGSAWNSGSGSGRVRLRRWRNGSLEFGSVQIHLNDLCRDVEVIELDFGGRGADYLELVVDKSELDAQDQLLWGWMGRMNLGRRHVGCGVGFQEQRHEDGLGFAVGLSWGLFVGSCL